MPGRIAVGMQYDERGDLLWVAGGTTGAVTAYDGRSGREVYRRVVPGSRFFNDVDVTRGAVYVTDSRNAELVVVPLRKGAATVRRSCCRSPATSTSRPANGIRALPTGDLLIVAAGSLFAVDPGTGVADRVDLTGPALTGGSGLELDGRRLYVVFGFGRDSIAVVDSPRASPAAP